MSEQDCRRQAKPGRGKKECGEESRNRKCGLNKRNCRQGPGSFRAMCRGKCGNLGNIGNDESVTCRPHYPGDGTNPPPLRFPLLSSGLRPNVTSSPNMRPRRVLGSDR